MKKIYMVLVLFLCLLSFSGCGTIFGSKKNPDKLIIQMEEKVTEISDKSQVSAILASLTPLTSEKSIQGVGFHETISVHLYEKNLQIKSYLLNEEYLYTASKTYKVSKESFDSLYSFLSPMMKNADAIQPDYLDFENSSYETLPVEKALLGEYAAPLYFSSANPEDRAHAHFIFDEDTITQWNKSFPYKIVDKTKDALLLDVYEDDTLEKRLFQMKISFDSKRKVMKYEKVFHSVGPEQYFPEELVRLCEKGPILSYSHFNDPFFYEEE